MQDDPDAARHAVSGTESLSDLEAVIAVSDGASRAYDLLEVLTLHDFTAQATDGPLEDIADAVRRAEDERARDLARLGMKVHDDLTIVSTRLRR